MNKRSVDDINKSYFIHSRLGKNLSNRLYKLRQLIIKQKFVYNSRKVNLVYFERFNRSDQNQGLNKNLLDFAARPRLQFKRKFFYKKFMKPSKFKRSLDLRK